jgi:hypothetical protein
LQRAQGDVEIRDVRPRAVVAPAVDELADEEVRLLLLQGAVEVAGAGEALRGDAERPLQGAEIRGEEGFDE